MYLVEKLLMLFGMQWEAVDLNYWETVDLEWYDPDAATTRDGKLEITISEQVFLADVLKILTLTDTPFL